MKKYFIMPVLFILCSIINISGKDLYAIKNVTIIPVSSPPIQSGTIVIKGEKISALAKGVSIPPEAEIVDGTGLFAYPGMIDALSIIGLNEIGSVRATSDYRETGSLNSFIEAATAINPHSVHIPITRVNGVTSAHIIPGGKLICGQSCLVNLDGWTIEEMLIKNPVGIQISFPSSEVSSDYKKPTDKRVKETKEQFEKSLKILNDIFEKTRAYDKALIAFREGVLKEKPAEDLMLEALVPVIKKELPVIINVNKEKDIKEAVKFVREENLLAIFCGVTDGWKTADILSQNNIPVILSRTMSLPGRFDPYDAMFSNASILYKSGVKFAFSTMRPTEARNLPYHAGAASAFGLPQEEALKGVTLYPAEILGVADKLGSLEAGKIANIIVCDGDILEIRTQIKHLFINGKKIPLKSKHTELYETYRKRP